MSWDSVVSILSTAFQGLAALVAVLAAILTACSYLRKQICSSTPVKQASAKQPAASAERPTKQEQNQTQQDPITSIQPSISSLDKTLDKALDTILWAGPVYTGTHTISEILKNKLAAEPLSHIANQTMAAAHAAAGDLALAIPNVHADGLGGSIHANQHLAGAKVSVVTDHNHISAIVEAKANVAEHHSIFADIISHMINIIS